MKTVHFASILVLAAATAFACNDDGDRAEGGAGSAGSAGKPSAAGSAGKPSVAGSSSAGAGGGDAGSMNDGGVSGVGGSNESGAAGSNEGGAAGGGGEMSDAGAAGSGLGGAGGEGGAGVQGPLEIIGSWDSGFSTEVITATDWTSFSADAILAYDNDANVVYTQIAATATYFPNKFTKIVYTAEQANSFYYCTIVYNADTLEAAVADTTVADASDPDHKGCGSFDSAWTKLTRL